MMSDQKRYHQYYCALDFHSNLLPHTLTYSILSPKSTRFQFILSLVKLISTKLPHITKDLIGNYHHGLNIEHAKPVLEKRPDSELVVGRHTNCH